MTDGGDDDDSDSDNDYWDGDDYDCDFEMINERVITGVGKF